MSQPIPYQLPADIPLDARAVITWDGAPDLVRAILAQCAGLRRLYLVQLAPNTIGSPSFAADERVVMLPIEAARPLAPQITPVWDAGQIFFAEARVALYLPPEFRALQPQLAENLERFTLTYLRQFYSDMAFRTVRGWHVLENILLNIPALPNTHALAELEGAAAGLPVVVIGAGPALDQNIEWLQAIKSQVLLIACDAAWLPLDKAGITPDIVVSTDAGDIVWRFWAALSGRQNIPLVALLQSSWPAVRYHQGPLYLCRSPWQGYDAVEAALKQRLDFLDSGRSVGHAAFEVARRLGAETIILAGFNLAFQADRFHPREMAVPVFHSTPPPPENLLQVPGLDGQPVVTDLSMYAYLREFEERFAMCVAGSGNTRIWDATGAGARKIGAQPVEPSDVLAICKGRTKHEIFDSGANTQRTAPVSSAVCAAVLQAWHQESTKLLECIESVATHLEREPHARLQTGLPGIDSETELAKLMAIARNPRLIATTCFAWEDARQLGKTTAELVETTARYLQDLRQVAGITAEITAHAIQEQAPDITSVLVLSQPDSQAAPAWAALLEDLRRNELTLHFYQGEPDDLPAIWRQFRQYNAGVALTYEDTVMPAAWHLPGRICLNLRYNPPNHQSQFNPAENWMPGYIAIAMNDAAAHGWSKRLPPDCPLYNWRAPGRLTSWNLAELTSWQKLLHAERFPWVPH